MGHQSPAQYNPADYVMDLVNQDMKIREDLKVAYAENKQPTSRGTAGQYLFAEPSGSEADLVRVEGSNLADTKHSSKWPIGFLAQLAILFSRTSRLTGKAQLTFLSFGQALGLAIISGLCWLRMDFAENTIPDRSSFIFFIMTFWPMQTLMQGLLSFPFERAVIEKERASGSYRLSAYFMAKSLGEAPLKLILPTMFLIISYWMANINPNFGIFLAILIFQLLAILVAESLGLLLGAAFENLARAISVATVILLSLMLVGGFFVQSLPHWLGVWSKWLSFFKYAYDACLQLQFRGDRPFRCVNGNFVESCRQNLNGTFLSHEALGHFNIGLNIGLNFLVLFGMFVCFRFLAYCALRFIKNSTGRA